MGKLTGAVGRLGRGNKGVNSLYRKKKKVKKKKKMGKKKRRKRRR